MAKKRKHKLDASQQVVEEMKALTISQPYASLIADGAKPVENRYWPINYRGPLAIHAGKGSQYLNRAQLREYPTGVVVAKCQLIACFELAAAIKMIEALQIPKDLKAIGWTPGHMAWLLHHEYTEGPFCWVLSDIERVMPPVVATGKQGLWNWNE